MKKTIILTCLLIFTFEFNILKAQATKNYDFEKMKIKLYDAWWQNPAMRFLYPVQHHTELSLNGEWSENKAGLIQEGNALRNFNFRVNSFFKNSKKLYYGKAEYNNGFNSNVKWCNVADNRALYPYIIADTLETKMNKESYLFAGGYATRFRKIGIGLFGSYHAAKSFKEIDPRPLNTSSELNLNIGTTYPFFKHHILGLDFSYEKYQQNQDIRVFKDVHSIKLYFLRGLGVADKYFSKKIYESISLNNKYRKNRFQGNLTLLPTNNSGYIFSLSTGVTDLELLSDDNRIIVNLEKKQLKTQLGYKFSYNETPFVIKIKGEYNKDKGKEYNYDRGTSLMAPIIAPKFKKENYLLEFTAIANYRWNKKVSAYYQLFANYFNDEEKYMALNKAANMQKYSNINVGMKTATLIRFKHNSLFFKADLSYRKNNDKVLNVSYLIAPWAKKDLVIPDYNNLTSDVISYKLAMRYDYKINQGFALYGRALFHYAKHIKMAANQYINIGIGLAF